MTDRVTCDVCGALSEKTNTSYTLISGTGWRLTRQVRPDGKVILGWNCPKCWAKRKARGSQTPAAK